MFISKAHGMPVCPIMDSRTWSHMSTRNTDKNHLKSFASLSRNSDEKEKEKKKTRMTIAKLFPFHANVKIVNNFLRLFFLSFIGMFITLFHTLYCIYPLTIVTYRFQSESTLCSCLNVKEFLDRNRRDIWSLSESNGIQTHKPLSS